MERKNADNIYKWDLSPIFASEKEWEEACNKMTELTGRFESFRGRLGERSAIKELYALDDDVSVLFENIYVYAYMLLYLDSNDRRANEMAQKAVSLSAAMSAATAFITPELLGLDESILDSYINDPEFATHRYGLTRIKENKKHVLGEKEEYIIARYSEVLGQFKEIFSKINDADFPNPVLKFGGERMPLTHGTYSMLLQNRDGEVRKKAFKEYYKIFGDRLETISACYAGNVRKRNITCSLKNYSSALEASLLGDDVPKEVYTTLIKEVEKALPSVHDYVAFRKSILGTQHMYDMYVPLYEGTGLKLEFPEAFELVKKALAPMGEEYLSRLQKMLDGRRIDVYEAKGKRSGAFSWGVYGKPFVLLNYSGTTHDVFTIAHELGHAMHSYYSDEALPYENAGYSIFVAEVASTTNEVLLLKYLINTTEDPVFRKFLLSYYLDMFRTTLFRQTMFSEFEEFAHKKDLTGSLTTGDMSDYYYELNKKYYGDAVVHDKEIAIEWSRIPHFYNAFYVYKYATGLTAAVTFASGIFAGDAEMRKNYFDKFLRAGGSKSPYEILADAGVDLKTEIPYGAAFKEFRETLDLLKKS